jgi:hypothetical protein
MGYRPIHRKNNTTAYSQALKSLTAGKKGHIRSASKGRLSPSGRKMNVITTPSGTDKFSP